jgi:hypothetical protein
VGFTSFATLAEQVDDVTAINNLLDHVGLFFHSFANERIEHDSNCAF